LLDANSVDNILVSQVYRRNVSPGLVGLYEVVNEHNVPIDVNGDPLLDMAGDFNPDFNVDEYSGLPELVKLTAHNNQNPLTSPNVSYNLINGNFDPSKFTLPPGARNDGTIFEVTIAGGGDGIGGNIAAGDRRPVLFRITPIWENNPPTGGNTYDLAEFTGDNAQAGQVVEYPDGATSLATRLYADTVYTYTGSFAGNKASIPALNSWVRALTSDSPAGTSRVVNSIASPAWVSVAGARLTLSVVVCPVPARQLVASL
jgi:hypothetical protein